MAQALELVPRNVTAHMGDTLETFDFGPKIILRDDPSQGEINGLIDQVMKLADTHKDMIYANETFNRYYVTVEDHSIFMCRLSVDTIKYTTGTQSMPVTVDVSNWTPRSTVPAKPRRVVPPVVRREEYYGDGSK